MIYGTGKIARTIVAHIDRGEDVLESLRKIVRDENIKNGVILTGYGTIDRCRIHAVTTTGLPPKDVFTTVEGPYELLAIDGCIANGEVHAHLTVADLTHAFGGHLEPGCRVLYLCDVAIGVLEDLDLAFATRPATGLKLLTVHGGREVAGPAVELDADGNVIQ